MKNLKLLFGFWLSKAEKQALRREWIEKMMSQLELRRNELRLKHHQMGEEGYTCDFIQAVLEKFPVIDVIKFDNIFYPENLAVALLDYLGIATAADSITFMDVRSNKKCFKELQGDIICNKVFDFKHGETERNLVLVSGQIVYAYNLASKYLRIFAREDVVLSYCSEGIVDIDEDGIYIYGLEYTGGKYRGLVRRTKPSDKEKSWTKQFVFCWSTNPRIAEIQKALEKAKEIG